MGNCCQNENTRDLESDRIASSIPAPIPQDSKKNSLIDPNYAKMSQLSQSKHQISQNNLINMNGLTQLHTNQNSFVSTPQQSGSSPHDGGFLSNSKNNVTEYNSFISGLLPYKEKDVFARIKQSSQTEFLGRSKFSRENQILRSRMKNFYIITSIYTPTMTNQKIELYNQFIQRMESIGCRMITIEFASTSSPFLVTEDNFQPYNFQVRLEDPIYLRFNIVNQVLKKLPETWEWIGIIDYNVQFEGSGWIEQVQDVLKANRIVQLFDCCSEVNLKDNTQINKYGLVSFLENLSQRESIDISKLQYSLEGGKAWAFRKDFFLEYQYLADIFITGFEETLLSLCLYGQCSQIFQNYLSEDGLRLIQKLEQAYYNEQNTQGYINGNITVIQLHTDLQTPHNLMSAVCYLNHYISNMYIDNLLQIHIRNGDQKEIKDEIRILNKSLL